MTPESDLSGFYDLQTENRHLKETVAALREEMEKMREGEQERLQHALVAAKDEIDQLHKMIAALREELERLKIECEEKCRGIEQDAREETRQLHEMIQTMRGRLEEYEKRQSPA